MTASMTALVAVPPCPAGVTAAPSGVIPGELARWRCEGGTIVLGIRHDGIRWVEVHARQFKLANSDDLAGLIHMLETAYRWQITPVQPELWEAAD